MIRTALLNKASEIISGERNEKYGPAEENFKYIAEFWSIYLGKKIELVDVGNMMILMKMARAINDKSHMDNYVDTAGYAALTAEVASNDL
tara:strand:- start:62 stop:331 length:270 start_codon:yes stop_codon:yes gene_type:complete